jgi:predicted RNase H-like HicB family nuclease
MKNLLDINVEEDQGQDSSLPFGFTTIPSLYRNTSEYFVHCQWDISHSKSVQVLAPTPKPNKRLLETFQEFLKISSEKFRQELKIKMIEREIFILRREINNLKNNQPISIPINTFHPAPYEILKPFYVVLKPDDNEFIAYFPDANISASGSTIDEAVFNIKDMITVTFDLLIDRKKEELGAIPRHQIQVLKHFLKKLP